MKKLLSLTMALCMAIGLTACGGGTPTPSPSNTNVADNNANTVEEKMELKLAHNLAEDHPLHIVVQQFADEVAEKTNNNVTIQIFPNGTLGNDREVLEQLQSGAVDITRVGSAALENFSDIYSAFTVPYIFDDKEHFYKVMDGPLAEKIYSAGSSEGLYGLTYYDGGSRSFYTKSKPINTPDDLKGLKMRVMENPSSIRMMQLFNASSTPMAYGDIYTALQQGVLDGAESNTTALTLGKHGEVAKFYSFDEHTRIPDFLIISDSLWNKLSDEYKQIFKEAAKRSTETHKELWQKALDDAVEQAKSEYGVEFSYPDKKPFQDAVAPIYDELKDKPEVYEIVQEIINTK